MKPAYADVEHWATIYLLQLKDALGDLTLPGDNSYIITGWEVNQKFRGEGYGAKLFDRMLADADAEKATLILSIEPDGTGLNTQQLKDFYHSRGFKQMEISEIGMIREPK